MKVCDHNSSWATFYSCEDTYLRLCLIFCSHGSGSAFSQ